MKNIKINFDFEALKSQMVILKSRKDGKLKSIKRVSPLEAANLLIKYSDLKNLKFFPKSEYIFLYDNNCGYYKQLGNSELKLFISHIFESLDIPEIQCYQYIDSVLKNLGMRKTVTVPGDILFDKGYIALQNGLLRLETSALQPWTPEIFLSSGLSFDYDPKAKCPLFEDYLKNFCKGYTDRINFVRSFLYTVLHQKIELQVFLHIHGPTDSGKSVLGNILQVMVGKEATHSTTLKALNQDQFEIANLIGKKLLLINDADKYSGNLNVLKSYTGGDSLRGRKMFTQGTIEVWAQGIAVIISNSPLSTEDRGNAIYRRMRALKTCSTYDSRKYLLGCVNGVWTGLLVEELPGIFNWILENPECNLKKYIEEFSENVKSLNTSLDYTKKLLSPLESWMNEEVLYVTDKGTRFGSYLGYGMHTKGKKTLIQNKRVLYPAYVDWSKKHGTILLNHSNFSRELLMVCESKGYQCEKIRKKEGVFITLLTLHIDTLDADIPQSAPFTEYRKNPTTS